MVEVDCLVDGTVLGREDLGTDDLEGFFKAKSVEIGNFVFPFASGLLLVAAACLLDVEISEFLLDSVLPKLAFRWLLEATEGTLGEDFVRTAFSNSEKGP